jgi:hypothetical protein
MEKIEILFKEYDTLRTEIIGRGNLVYQLIGGSGAILIWLISKPINATWFVSVAISLAAIGPFVRLLHRDFTNLAERIRELESEINGISGEQLLKYETTYGAAATGRFWRKPPKSK